MPPEEGGILLFGKARSAHLNLQINQGQKNAELTLIQG